MIFRILACLQALALVCLLVGARADSAHAGGGGYDLGGISDLVQTEDPTIDQAQRYALAVLGEDFDGNTHVAALHFYSNPWIRDSFAWGMIPSLRDGSVSSYSGEEISYWLQRQQPFGGWLTAPKSGYFDETPILIAAVLDAYRVTGDLRLVRSALPRLERGWRWLAHGFIRPRMGSSVLIYANVPPHTAADWADQISRHGYATQLEALWYWATHSLAVMETLTNHPVPAHRYLSFATRIRADINRLLWTVSVPYVLNAAPVAAFGHYRSWAGGRDYFELDSNALCILYGIADRQQAASIDQFIVIHQAYLLGLDGGAGVPARVLYGDYDRRDFASRHGRIGSGRYQSAYWPSVGALVAMALAHAGDLTEARAILYRLSQVFVRDADIREWYANDGSGQGAPAFGWAARMFIVALYSAYLGVDAYDSRAGAHHIPAGISLHTPIGPGAAELSFHGRPLTVSVTGSGRRLSVSVGRSIWRRSMLPGDLLCAGCSVKAVWSG